MTIMKYRRLEFVFDIGQGPRVLAFVDFSSHISFGIPRVYQFTDHVIKPTSENYERITVHNDGKVKTHLPLAQGFSPKWDGQYSPLANWNEPWSMFEELDWSINNPSVRDYLAKPKNIKTNPYTLAVPLIFPTGVSATQIRFFVLSSIGIDLAEAIAFAPEIRDSSFCTWFLADAWPYVLISIRNPLRTSQCVELKSIGRDYRK